jgi:hypothetical protein
MLSVFDIGLAPESSNRDEVLVCCPKGSIRSPCCLCVFEAQPIDFWMAESVFMKLHKSPHIGLCVFRTYYSGRQVCKNVTAARNSHATVQELLDSCVFVFFHRCKVATQSRRSRVNKQLLEASFLCAVRVVSNGSRQLVVIRSSWFYFIDYQPSGRGGCTLCP